MNGGHGERPTNAELDPAPVGEESDEFAAGSDTGGGPSDAGAWLRCPACGQNTPAGVRLCRECGHLLEARRRVTWAPIIAATLLALAFIGVLGLTFTRMQQARRPVVSRPSRMGTPGRPVVTFAADFQEVSIKDARDASLVAGVGDEASATPGLVLRAPVLVRTGATGRAQIALGKNVNTVTLHGDSELMIDRVVVDTKRGRPLRQPVDLRRGEATFQIGLEGREVLFVRAGRIMANGFSGLFKVIYGGVASDSGRVVVKNGLVDVSVPGPMRKSVKVSGFYEARFVGDQLDKPKQASIIQFNWR